MYYGTGVWIDFRPILNSHGGSTGQSLSSGNLCWGGRWFGIIARATPPINGPSGATKSSHWHAPCGGGKCSIKLDTPPSKVGGTFALKSLAHKIVSGTPVLEWTRPVGRKHTHTPSQKTRNNKRGSVCRRHRCPCDNSTPLKRVEK